MIEHLNLRNNFLHQQINNQFFVEVYEKYIILWKIMRYKGLLND